MATHKFTTYCTLASTNQQLSHIKLLACTVLDGEGVSNESTIFIYLVPEPSSRATVIQELVTRRLANSDVVSKVKKGTKLTGAFMRG